MDFDSVTPSVVKSIKQRDLLNTWIRLYVSRSDAKAQGGDRPRAGPSVSRPRRHRDVIEFE